MMRPALPKTIRWRTAAILSAGITALWLAAAGLTARILTAEMSEVFDSALQETGQRVLQLAVLEVLGREDDGISQQLTALNGEQEFFIYVVRDGQGRALLTSHNADPAQFPIFDAEGFHDTDQTRFYTQTAVRGTIILTIAEPLEHRKSAAREVAMGLALPLLAVIPLSILAIAYGLGIGLRPLVRLRRQLAQRGAGDLTPLDADGLPGELRPIAAAANQVFARLRTALEAERAFAANAAHELRTPLAGASAQLQRLRAQTAVPATAARADEIGATLKRLTRLSERLIQLARAEGADLRTAQPHDLRFVLRLIADDFGHGADARRVQMDLPDMPVMSGIDPDAVAIVARNLFENALRHGDGGAVRVSLSADGWLRVENDGPAVPPDLLARLGTRFARGAGGEGSGLGLAIVRTIADRAHAPLTLGAPIHGRDAGFWAVIQLI